MKIEKFEDLIVWQRAEKYTISIYEIFSKCKDYGFCDQIRRAAVSVMNNIAEGFERRSNKEFVQFLYIAKGSAGEVRSMLYIANERKYVSDEEFKTLSSNFIEISKLLAGLIKSLQKSA